MVFQNARLVLLTTSKTGGNCPSRRGFYPLTVFCFPIKTLTVEFSIR